MSCFAHALGIIILVLAMCAPRACRAQIPHVVPEGHVGLYFRGGRLLEAVAEPGMYLHLPFITSMIDVLVRVQTDVVRNVPCGTKDGIMSEFERVEVVNALRKDKAHSVVKAYGADYDVVWIHDKIHHEINKFCSNKTLREVYVDDFAALGEVLEFALQTDLDIHANGVSVIAVRTTKPTIPDSIRRNYEAMEEQRTAALVALRTHEVVERELETERVRVVSTARKHAEEAEIKSVAEARRARLQAETQSYEEKLIADSKRYSAEEEAAANEALLTEPYLRLQATRVWEHTTKAYFGERIPTLMIDPVQPANSAAMTTASAWWSTRKDQS
ncbi:hypothetical protein CYMTET_3255 [Cymbomonas tetramitiformis]|uniref:Band 7 domain-containing protein n=1 Tax=Cymbomonas tetramitiformis TaxID=36881 RepID=A0AAE0LL69_9CHLO|nr:hypothetical protein CYMTET_3255 [Cymbomonas tetramitiformis]